MSAYDTVDRSDSYWVRVYCETPMDLQSAVMLEVTDPTADERTRVMYMAPDEAVRLATALLNAAQQALHAAKVDGIVGGG